MTGAVFVMICDKREAASRLLPFGAASRNRTGTVFLPADFKSAMSTDFIMAANHKIAPILALIAVRVKWAVKTCAARVGIPARAAQMPSIAPLAQDSVHQRFVLCGTL